MLRESDTRSREPRSELRVHRTGMPSLYASGVIGSIAVSKTVGLGSSPKGRVTYRH